MTAEDRTLVMYGDGVRDAARRMLPKLPDACFVPAGTEALRAAVKDGLAQVVLVAGMDGQVAFLDGAGVLESITLDMDGGAALAAEVAAAPTARDAYALWEAAGRLGPCGRELCRRTAGELERLAAEAAGSAASPVAAQVVLVDAAGERMVGMYGRMAR
ncbi:hypothetical protein [Actinomadura livida]|uniref:Uncharacterized protein n=1 Tax=Actinomadura livida TaxID=79909 RepID=A0A7W7IAR1_9ACTN|nr:MULTISPECIES: hypothetical protein [Actinomadura]MBB4773666.1 hypothetical protein [Actinomadura catellatispora]GGU09883.1 hypothetical protein GCM10010208_38080 [Actinomadura livida]